MSSESSGEGGSERRSEQTVRCVVCFTPKSNTHWGIMAVIVWAARRARRAARAEKKGADT